MSRIAVPVALRKLVLLKLRFATSSSIASALDYGVFVGLTFAGVRAVPANLISATLGFLVNFFLQKRFIFILNRKMYHSLILSAGFSAVGIALSTLLIWLFVKLPFFAEHQYIAKLVVMGLVFFYNFYTKRFAFEKRLLG